MNIKKLYLIEPHYQHLYQNRCFDKKKYPMNYKIRQLLKKKGVILDTVDLHDIRKADKIFFVDFNDFTFFDRRRSKYLDLCIKYNVPKKKLNLIIFECPVIKPYNWYKDNHKYFSKIFTWNDSVVDNKKYFHFFVPIPSDGIKTRTLTFASKKLLVLINMNKVNYFDHELYSLRRNAIRFFERHHKVEFDLYGVGWSKPLKLKFIYSILKGNTSKLPNFISDYLDNLKGFPSYRGEVKNKYKILSRYKYSLCFENMSDVDGNISEKIFDCFKAKCVPVYYGGKNIADYVPEDLFIDFRKFSNFEELYIYLKNITKKQYNQHIDRIKRFLISKQFKKWDYIHYCNDIFLHQDLS